MENTTTPKADKFEAATAYYQRQLEDATRVLTFVNDNREALEKLNLRFYSCGSYIDFDNLQRPDVTAVLKAFKCKWDKTASYDKSGINYTSQEEFSGFKVRCYNGEPPPSCKIVETVTYKRVPARRERIVTRTVVCNDGSSKVS